jgi:hypothetical protein
MPMLVSMLSALVLWVYAARYLYGGVSCWRSGLRFQFGPLDGIFLRGKSARPGTTIALGLAFFLLPLALMLRLWWVATQYNR